MKNTTRTALAILALGLFPLQSQAAVVLGTASGFSVLAGSTATNTGLSIIGGGNVGVSPGTSLTGFLPGVITPPFTMHSGDATSLQAQIDLTTAYNAAAAALPVTQDLTGVNLGGLTLLPGVYKFSSSAQLTGALVLNANSDPNAQFIFQIGSTLTTAAGSSVVTINNVAAQPCIVFWQVGSSATLGAGNEFQGHILALASITVGAGTAIVSGSALAITGAVTLDTDQMTGCSALVVPTRPSTWSAVKTYYR
jgi:type VI secretion system secreted protein VgrG